MTVTDQVTLFTAGVAVFVALWNIFTWYFQRRDTQRLAKLTSELEHRVHRLSVNLDQTIYRYTRARDLITGLLKVSLALRQIERSHDEKLNYAIEREIALPELDALVRAINDATLTEKFNELASLLTNEVWVKLWNRTKIVDQFGGAGTKYLQPLYSEENVEITPKDYGILDKLLIRQNQLTKEMHKRLLELWEQATKAEVT